VLMSKGKKVRFWENKSTTGEGRECAEDSKSCALVKNMSGKLARLSQPGKVGLLIAQSKGM